MCDSDYSTKLQKQSEAILDLSRSADNLTRAVESIQAPTVRAEARKELFNTLDKIQLAIRSITYCIHMTHKGIEGG